MTITKLDRSILITLAIVILMIALLMPFHAVYAEPFTIVIGGGTVLKYVIFAILAWLGIEIGSNIDMEYIVQDFIRTTDFMKTEWITPLRDYVILQTVKGIVLSAERIEAAQQAFNAIHASFVNWINGLNLQVGDNNISLDYNERSGRSVYVWNPFESMNPYNITSYQRLMYDPDTGRIKTYTSLPVGEKGVVSYHSIYSPLGTEIKVGVRNASGSFVARDIYAPGFNSEYGMNYNSSINGQTVKTKEDQYGKFIYTTSTLYFTYIEYNDMVYEMLYLVYIPSISDTSNPDTWPWLGDVSPNLYRLTRSWTKDYVESLFFPNEPKPTTPPIPIYLPADARLNRGETQAPSQGIIVPPLITDIPQLIGEDGQVTPGTSVGEVLEEVIKSPSYPERVREVAGNPPVGGQVSIPPIVAPTLETDVPAFNPDVEIPGYSVPGTYVGEGETTVPAEGTLSGIQSIAQSIQATLSQALDSIKSIATAITAPAELDLEYFKNITILQKFPFSLPWDFARMIGQITAAQKVPRFEVDLIGYVMVIDFALFQRLATQIRLWLTLIYAVGLIYATKRLMGDR